jgi:hypothetical protein
MKFTVSLIALILFILPSCFTEKFTNCYKGRLENVPNCGAPVIKILQGDLSRIEHEDWVNPATSETHNDVFVIKNYCDFYGARIEEGEEFYFVVQSSMDAQPCIICTALYPVPAKINIIKVVKDRACE